MSKTPVSILQELMVKRNSLPSFELLPNSEGIGTHIPTFHYRVIAGPVQAIGTAHSKKDAKHEAAKLALDKLADLGLYCPTNNMSSSPMHTSTSDPSSPQKLQINAVGSLQELCSERNIPQPIFKIIADIGPAHLRQFTVECQVATMSITATDSTKKKAKQVAAHKMLHRLIDSLPEVIEELSDDMTVSTVPAFELPLEDLIKSYSEISTLNKKKINWGMKICEYPNNLKSIMAEKNIQMSEILDDLSTMNIDKLQNVLDKFDLHYTLDFYKQEESIIATVSIDSAPEFVTGSTSTTKSKALNDALIKMIDFLKIMLK